MFLFNLPLYEEWFFPYYRSYPDNPSYGCSGISSDPFDNLSVEWKLYSNSPDQGGICHTAFIFITAGKRNFPLLTGCCISIRWGRCRARMFRLRQHRLNIWVEILPACTGRRIQNSSFRLTDVHCYMRGWVLKKTDAPSGLYFVIHQNGKEKILQVKDLSFPIFPIPIV